MRYAENKAKNGSRRGSTIIEVLMAISVLAIGASGIMALQKATLVANRNAKNLEIANAIASTWMQRLRTDSVLWNTTSDINTDTTWMKNHVGNQGSSNWFRPENSGLAIWGVHNRFGDDDHTGQTNGPFCVNIRLTWLKPGRALRADVRVYWLRDGLQASSGNLSMAIPKPLCGATATAVPAVENAPDEFHIVQYSTAILSNQVD